MGTLSFLVFPESPARTEYGCDPGRQNGPKTGVQSTRVGANAIAYAIGRVIADMKEAEYHKRQMDWDREDYPRLNAMALQIRAILLGE